MNFEQAPCDILCRDEWPQDTIRRSALLAYRFLDDFQQIHIQYPVVLFPDKLVITYYAQLPAEWVRDRLRKAEMEIMGAAEKQTQMEVA